VNLSQKPPRSSSAMTDCCRASVPTENITSRVYLWPKEHDGVFMREQWILEEGLADSPTVTRVHDPEAADYILYLLSGPVTPAAPFGSVDPGRVAVVDYGDQPEVPPDVSR
jgi:hypothetical protein